MVPFKTSQKQYGFNRIPPTSHGWKAGWLMHGRFHAEFLELAALNMIRQESSKSFT